jgi:hypothetical protein
MKLINYLLLILINTNTNAQFVKDTVYKNKNSDQVIFIDTPHSKYHDLVFKFLLSDLKQNPSVKTDAISKENLYPSYFGDWITVKKFKGKYFAYFPSEPFYNTFLNLSDSLILINDFNEGFVSYKIDRKKEKSKKIKLKLIKKDGLQHFISIRQKSKTLFILKSNLFTAKKLFFVKKHSYYDYPIIVNYCPLQRCQEFNFQ